METPKQTNNTKVVIGSFCGASDGAIHHFLIEVKDDIYLVRKYNTTVNTIGSKKLFTGIYSRHLTHYQLAIPWLRPHLISLYKSR
jgi:hypothetical protein